jgi:hypothetical protein
MIVYCCIIIASFLLYDVFFENDESIKPRIADYFLVLTTILIRFMLNLEHTLQLVFLVIALLIWNILRKKHAYIS